MIKNSIQSNNITTPTLITTTILIIFVHEFPTVLCVRLALSLPAAISGIEL
jgi:hypothetical protein